MVFLVLRESKESADGLLTIVFSVLMVGAFLLPVVTLYWVNTERILYTVLVKWLVSLILVLGCLGALEMLLACAGLWHEVFGELQHSYNFFEVWSTTVTAVAISPHAMFGLRLMLTAILLCSLSLALLVQWQAARDKKL